MAGFLISSCSPSADPAPEAPPASTPADPALNVAQAAVEPELAAAPDAVTESLSAEAAAALAESEKDPASTPPPPVTPEFDFEDVRRKAEILASRDFQTPPGIPKEAGALDYDGYRRIQLRPEVALWSDATDKFRVLPDPRGYLFNHAIRLNVVADGNEVPRPYSADDFNFYDLPLPDEAKKLLGFAGFRVVSPLNIAGKWDELISFRGASFFRALGAGNLYGASARGISIGTASPEGEQFPYFREFWIVKPVPGADSIRIYALMDGESITGAYEFTVSPGPETKIQVTATLFPRKPLSTVGISPLTSMYFFSPHDIRKNTSDFRPAVHDSEGLSIQMYNGEWVWRPLFNPKDLQVSVLADRPPLGFGLVQRKRAFEDYSDIEAGYHHRPTVWVQPKTGWGEGALTLVEIPTANEYNDNIVAYWKPKVAWQPGTAYTVSYDMKWSLLTPSMPDVATVENTFAGVKPGATQQLFVIDYDHIPEALVEGAEADVTTSAGKILNPVIKTNPETGKIRLSFELEAPNTDVAELRALLTKGGKPVTETWLYRWRKE
ncbi:glucan biosynthesis protein G [Hyphomonas sp. WL0036]|uniref:glucan biosynthesis protein G n=1 Tax=Hyphomonas sediminis TaxID=2866160 RepID=UPI001C7F05A6|nr:glucan biosynthesis protein G [Hyphomonas sediminis]MBY9068041.1 glucan biosynthesis protein G [Hyphomonas sediminis]